MGRDWSFTSSSSLEVVGVCAWLGSTFTLEAGPLFLLTGVGSDLISGILPSLTREQLGQDTFHAYPAVSGHDGHHHVMAGEHVHAHLILPNLVLGVSV